MSVAIQRRTWVRRRASAMLLGAALVCPAFPATVQAQEQVRPDTTFFELLGLDRLQLVSLGAEVGVVAPSTIESAPVVALVADYGELRPGWRVAFTASYWESKFTDAAVRRLEDSLATAIRDPTGDAVVDLGEVRYAALAITADVRRRLAPWRRVRPYAGFALGAMATNADGTGISGTLVENAFDTIGASISALAGLDILLVPNFALSMHARYDLASGLRAGTLRAGGAYVLDVGGFR